MSNKILITGATSGIGEAATIQIASMGANIYFIARNEEKAKNLSKEFGINNVFDSLEEAFQNKDHIFDLALPPANLLEVVEKLPNNIYAIFQKPLGRSLEEGNKIRKICHQKNIKACMNFQLRFSPISLPVYEAIKQNILGELVELY